MLQHLNEMLEKKENKKSLLNKNAQKSPNKKNKCSALFKIIKKKKRNFESCKTCVFRYKTCKKRETEIEVTENKMK